MIYTLTLNPSLDYHIYKPEFIKGEVNRANDTYITFGGKGLNVSSALAVLNTKSVALGFAGGFCGKEIKRLLDEKGIRNKLIDISPENSRINIKLHSDSDTDINAPGPKPSEKQLGLLISLLSLLKENDVLCLCGSAPDTESFRKIISSVDSCVKLVADVDGENLKEAVLHKPFLVKPNEKELLELFSETDNSEQNIIKLGSRLRSFGIEFVLISRGEKGLLLLSQSGIYKAEGIKGIPLNTVGAGDFSVAGFLSEYLNSFNEISALKSALSASAAKVFSKEDPGYFDMRKYANIAEIKKIK